MRFKGGYNVLLKGRPGPEVTKLPEPDKLLVPLFSKRFNFSGLCVKENDSVKKGQVLAKDPDNYDIPLLAPCAGTIKTDEDTKSIILENAKQGTGEAVDIDAHLPEAAKKAGDAGKALFTLLQLGAWSFLSDAFTGDLPDPYGKPQAVIIPVMHLEPFLVDTGVFLPYRMSEFTKGIEQLSSITTDTPIYLVLPKKKAEYSADIKNLAKQNSRVHVISVPAKYPFDNAKLIAQSLNLEKNSPRGAVWTLDVQGVLAIDTALSSSKPVVNRIVSISGPGTNSAEHFECVIGYPLKEIYKRYRKNELVRVINGGIMTGDTIVDDTQFGIDVECTALTCVMEHTKREILAFAHPGFTKHAYSNTVFSAFFPLFNEAYTTGVRGELRPCLSCGFCEQACPARILPHLVNKYCKKDRLDEALKYGLELCIQCGLCSLVCPSKIENKQGLFEAQQKIKKMLLSKEVQA